MKWFYFPHTGLDEKLHAELSMAETFPVPSE